MKLPLMGDDLKSMFELVYNKKIPANESHTQLAQIYKKHNDKEFEQFDKKKSVGFKMRFREWDTIEQPIVKNSVTVFVLIRKNVFKWALSTYDSESNQFKLIKGQTVANPTITVDIPKFTNILNICKRNLTERHNLITMLKGRGTKVVPIYYEDFCDNKKQFFKTFLSKIDIKLTDKELTEFVEKQNFFKKVHGDNLQQYVTNYDELKKVFGSIYDF
jgi:hypothetical protein